MSQLKAIYTETFIDDFAKQVCAHQADFNSLAFKQEILTADWPVASVRQRMQRIATSLGQHLAGDYPEQLELILALHQTNQGFNFLFLPDFVSIYGLNDTSFDLSLAYLKKMTPYSSAEFAIRPFIAYNEPRCRPFLNAWSTDPDEHVRRLASEGSRPRLPWGIQLQTFIEQPELNLALLTTLKNDPALYVRKSVANHLNDISKTHPDVVVALCRSWQNEEIGTDWIIKRACRTLVKKAYPPALALFGYDAPGSTFEVLTVNTNLNEASFKIGESLTFNYEVATTLTTSHPLRLEFGINYMKANGKLALKKFHLTDGLAKSETLKGTKTLSFKNLSTRKHYPGEHALKLFLNGQEISHTPFTLKEDISM